MWLLASKAAFWKPGCHEGPRHTGALKPWISIGGCFFSFQPTVKVNSSKVVFENVSGKCVTFQFLVIRLLKTASFHR